MSNFFTKRNFLILGTIVFWSAGLVAQESGEAMSAAAPQPTPPAIQIVPYAELGAAIVLDHHYRSGALADGNTDFNFITQGGQEILSLYSRYTVEAILGGQSIVTLLYQPLTLNTKTVAGRNGTGPVQIDGVAFPAGTPMDITYGFDFFRLSYLYNFLSTPGDILGIGLSLQLRNASISFTSTDGTLRAISQNLGPVPIIKIRAAHWFDPLFGLDFIADGFYASGAGFNGSGKPFEGWIWDGSLSIQTRLIPAVITYLTVRSIGGGANGSNAYDATKATTSVNKETYNTLATLAVTLGVSLDPGELGKLLQPR